VDCLGIGCWTNKRGVLAGSPLLGGETLNTMPPVLVLAGSEAVTLGVATIWAADCLEALAFEGLPTGFSLGEDFRAEPPTGIPMEPPSPTHMPSDKSALVGF
jgi:hypothetical protein